MSVTKVAEPDAEERTGSQQRIPAGPVTDGIRTLEVRWIFAGRPPAVTAAWIGRFPARTVRLEDAYLVDPNLPGLSDQPVLPGGRPGHGECPRPGGEPGVRGGAHGVPRAGRGLVDPGI